MMAYTSFSRWRSPLPAETKRRRRRTQRTGRVNAAPHAATKLPAVKEVVDVYNLLRVFQHVKRHGGQAPGIDGVHYDDIGHQEALDVFRTVTRSICAGKYCPQATRITSIPKTDGGKRQLRIGVIVDRVVATAMNDALALKLEEIYLPRSHGFRPRRSSHTLLAELELMIETTGRRVLVNDDIRKAFDNVPIGSVMECFKEIIKNEPFLNLVQIILRGAEGERRTIGIDQGCPLSPTALNVLLHFSHDLPIHRGHLLWQRYVDNLIYVCQDMTEGNQIRRQAQSLLDRVGLNLKGNGNTENLINLDTGSETQLLGYTLSYREDELKYGIGDTSWRELEEDLAKAYTTVNPNKTAQSIIMGWLDWCGPAFENGATRFLLERILSLSHKQGFRDVISLRTAHSRWEQAACNWQSTKQRAANAYHLSGSQW